MTKAVKLNAIPFWNCKDILAAFPSGVSLTLYNWTTSFKETDPPPMTHHKDISLSDIESADDKIPRTTVPSADDSLSVSSEVTLTERITSSSLCGIACLASSVPACSFVNLCLTLLGHLLFLIGTGKDAHIRTIPVSSSIAAGAIGGAVWGGACLVTIVILYMIYGPQHCDTLCRLGTVLAIASLVVAPPIGVAVMRGTFHGNILAPLTAMWGSVVGTSAVCFVTICLFMLFAFVTGL